ncbi:uncharacterized protein LOC129002994 [Macrosteles quadrilineatus]|uniref:uncharacterized protein LOC129002994 n=1 Tax=Macrosteles quadrilineatus TaxID=74068 RepID=UPI0023E0DAD5|nr:uncharacterized protein LOC129002994 [Macrosteles quadrilineatus]XP_054287147.1 uncharacterized protein LOC129002994 [Macrosteles quadrilineatus]
MASFDSYWDVDKYKNEFESSEHWELRRQFMVAHKHKYPELRLVCLTQVFFNMEFLGCKYPQKTMDLVNKLAGEVAGEFRESRKDKLKRTFVGAQDAAGAKAKGAKPPTGVVEGSVTDGPAVKKPRVEEQDIPCIEIKDEEEEENVATTSNDSIDGIEKYAEAVKEVAKTCVLLFPTRTNSKTETDPMNIIHANFHHSQITIRFEGTKAEGFRCDILVNPNPDAAKDKKSKASDSLLVGSAFGSTQRQGKYDAAQKAINYMKQYCTYIVPNPEWFKEGGTPDFIEKRIPCSKTPRTYLIMRKEDTGHISPEVADLLLENFKRSSNQDMFFPDVEYLEKEKIQLMNRSAKHRLGFRHFGPKQMMKHHHVCIFKEKTGKEIIEEAKQMGGKHPKYIIHYKK